ncbi:MAG: PTS transporter subunit EIIC [Bulleidia sp.]|nr:PTS transporter subunit EIIC [Bulleidia sp.]
MAQKYQALADGIMDAIGGKDNVTFFTHCVTRLRFNLKDQSRVQKEAVDKLPGVLGSQFQNGQYQVIIGQDVDDAYQLIRSQYGFAEEKAVDENLDDAKSEKKGFKGVMDKVFDGISGSLSPLIPALIGCGMIKVILILCDTFHWLPADSGTYMLLKYAGDAGFYFLPIMIGAFAAKKFGANPGLGMVIGGMLVYPEFAAGVSGGTAYNFLGIPVHGVGYSSTIFPIILSCAVMAPIEKFFAKHSPSILRSVLEPLLTIIVMIPLAYCVLGPLGSFLGQYLSAFVIWLYNTIGFVAVALLAAIMPFVVMTGMHGSFVPYLMQMLTVDPLYEPIFFPALVISNIDQGIAALAVALKTKDENLKSTGLSTALTAVIGGVTEPAMYAINLKFKTPMYGAMIGSAIGGAVAGILHVYIYAFAGASSVIALPCFIGGDKGVTNMVLMVVSIAVGCVATFIATMMLYKPEEK